MARYFTKASRKSYDDNDDYCYREPVAELVPSVCDHEATDTGLVTASGDAIWRGPNPVGFLWDLE